MAESYKCWRCGGTLFSVSTNAQIDDGRKVAVACAGACAGMAFADSVTQAFEMISRNPTEAADKPLT